MLDGRDRAHAIPRPTARVVAIDGRGRVLLMQGKGRFAPGVWFTPGGGLERGESHQDAACREFWEETSHRLNRLGPAVWTREHRWQARTGRWYRSEERFFLAQVSGFFPRFVGVDDAERAAVGAMRWWSLEAIQASDDTFAPRRLGALLSALVRGDVPVEPIEVGL